MKTSSSAWVDRWNARQYAANAIKPNERWVDQFIDSLERPAPISASERPRLRSGASIPSVLMPVLSDASFMKDAWIRCIDRLGIAAGTPLLGRARPIVDGLCFLGQGHYDAATFSLLPRLEYVARECSAVSTPSAGVPIAWNEILVRLDGVVLPDLFDLLHVHVVDSAGPSLRNQLVHGNIPGPTLDDGCLIAYALLLMLRDAAHGRSQ